MDRQAGERWASWLDSRAWRRVVGSTTGRRLRKTRLFEDADTLRRALVTSALCARDPGAYRSVETFCAFLGHVKSGGSLMGSMLDAHPGAIFADEVDVLRYLTAGFRRDQIFHLLERGARREALKGRVTARRLEPYSLAVPGLWQGRHLEPRVIGFSRAGPTTRRLGREPELLTALTSAMGDVRTRFVHVVRNPYDPIAAMILRSGRAVDDAIDDHAAQCAAVGSLRGRIPAEDLLTVRYETFVDAPAAQLTALCAHVGLRADPAYAGACASVVDREREPERCSVRWRTRDHRAVESLIASYDFLRGYRFDA